MKPSLSKILLIFTLIFSFTFVLSAQSSRTGRMNINKTTTDKPLKILSQPAPQLTKEQREIIKELKKEVIRLEVEFLDIGLVGAVNSLDVLPDEINEVLIKAAQEIKFEPEVKDGKRIDSIKIIEYSFKPKDISEIKTSPESAKKARLVLDKAVKALGGQKYLNIKTQIGEGKFSILRNGRNVSFQSFLDVIVYPNKERTDFKSGGSKLIQTNYGDKGWVFDETLETLEDQTESQVENFRRSMRINPVNFLRGAWSDEAVLSYVGRRQASLGKRNDVVKLTFEDGFEVEFEFSDKGLPKKAIYKRIDSEGREIKEENRFAQFVNIQGIKTPFIIDHFTNGVHTSRVNYESVEYNKTVPNSIFNKPENMKAAKKKLKL